ncbi:MAG TPA: L-threonylcarbamoyladenylate synthase [Saprospiraceae bacterium]|nr:L-threonylcarbamoyladenylate synthase [Saprospiraceae bacterium]
MLIQVHPENPEGRKINQIVDCLEKGGIIIYPTDTVYGLGCDIQNQHAVEKICRLKKLDPQKAQLTFICKDISQVSNFANQIDNEVFRLIKKNTPGPFTFILKSGNEIPKILKNKKKTIGIRIPDNKIAIAIVEALGRPILSASLKTDDDIIEYLTEPEEIAELFEKQVDMIIDGSVGGNVPSALIDCTVMPPELIREGPAEMR